MSNVPTRQDDKREARELIDQLLKQTHVEGALVQPSVYVNLVRLGHLIARSW